MHMTSETLGRGFGSAPIKRVAFGGVTAFAIFMASAGVTACAQLLVARLVGAETYGVYAYVVAWMTILAYFSALGFDIALLRFVSAYQTTGAWNLARGVIQYAERRNARRQRSRDVDGDRGCRELAPAIFLRAEEHVSRRIILVPLWALLWVRCSIVRAFGGVVLALLPDKVVRDGLLLTLVVLADLWLRRSISMHRWS